MSKFERLAGQIERIARHHHELKAWYPSYAALARNSLKEAKIQHDPGWASMAAANLWSSVHYPEKHKTQALVLDGNIPRSVPTSIMALTPHDMVSSLMDAFGHTLLRLEAMRERAYAAEAQVATMRADMDAMTSFVDGDLPEDEHEEDEYEQT